MPGESIDALKHHPLMLADAAGGFCINLNMRGGTWLKPQDLLRYFSGGRTSSSQKVRDCMADIIRGKDVCDGVAA